MDRALSIPTLRALRRILRSSEVASRQLAATTGLTLSQLLVLQEIGETGRLSPGSLSAALHFSHATITNICDRLESLGLVTRERDASDRRRIFVSATPAGVAAIKSAPDQLQQRFEEAFPALPLWEQAMILAGLDRLGDVLGIAAEDAAPLLDSEVIPTTEEPET